MKNKNKTEPEMVAHKLRPPRRMRQEDHKSRLTCKHSKLVQKKKQMDSCTKPFFCKSAFGKWEETK